ncbi:MAG TPA: hypothetical protein VFJ72_07890 [Rubrobacteraceae bacterium]|nr:hypothetical protein [Rubrobacteraceae bacterium]
MVAFGGGRKPLLVPDPGQKIALISEDGSTREGFRAVSGPLTSDTGETIVQVVTEREYQDARLDGRPPVFLSWPANRVTFPVPRYWWLKRRFSR